MSRQEIVDDSDGFASTRRPKPTLKELRSVRDVNDLMPLEAATPSC